MITGARLAAPDGFLSLSKGHIYHFLHSDANHNRVRLVEFTDDGKEVRVLLITLTRFDFEEALESGLLLEIGETDKFPPWLQPIQGVAVSEREDRRVSAKETYDHKVNRRFLAISELVQRIHEVLSSDNPDGVINAHAMGQKPQQNTARLRLWFYTYITFGQNKWALMPPLHRIGGWNREGPGKVRRLGRPSPKGKYWGYRCDSQMRERVGDAFLKHKSAYKTLDEVYSNILTQEFGCISVEKNDAIEFVHPQGLPFPTHNQIKYCIERMFSSKERSVAVRGKQKTRNWSGDIGSFAQNLTNLNQRVEFDGYYIVEKLSGVTEGSPVDSFCVVRAVCGLSGMVVGIGFSEGRENMEAYRMCLFSMTLDKVKFCELFGNPIKLEQWPCEGLSGGIVFDRGPGATYDAEPEIHWLGTFENTPVFSGQSKATVESSHPRDKTTLDQPTFFHSKLNFVQMARREIHQVLIDNRISDASSRMEERMYWSGIKPTPLGIWDYWDSRGRNSAIGMQFEMAIRTFLTEHPAVVREDAVFLYGRRYRSPALVATGVFDRVARKGVIPTKVFVLTMCVRHIWIDVDGTLYELDFVSSQRTVDGDIDISLRDLQELDELRRQAKTGLHNERIAAKQYFKDKFKQDTGEDWHSGERKLGRPSMSGSVQRDTADYNYFRGKAK
ncbi:transposase [Pseudomonas laurylsulfatiphila]|uniref:transposase n=1 Tax=Pseudomonas laurylsulfatiphila TaxID=2011015 RepID=UPI00215EADD4|nr:transposase [Pseudomonas laurylsulfatiphila]UVM05098.1 transposase [Pseudomonas laurylsulfatiphila]